MSRFDDATFELLSAYLDGELTVEERADVESLLESSEEHRTLLDELRSVSSQFVALPVAEPSSDLGLRINAAIADVTPPWLDEDAKQEPGSPVGVSAAPASSHAAESNSSRAAIGWILAIAAAIALMAWAYVQSGRVDDRIANEGNGPGTPDVNQDPDIKQDPDVGPVKPNGGQLATQDPKTNGSDTPNGVNQDPNLAPGMLDPNQIDPNMLDPNLLTGSSFVFDERSSDIMVVFEYAVREHVLADEKFQGVLKKHGVMVQNQLEPDEKAKKAILDSKSFGGVHPPAGGDVVMSIIVTDARTAFKVTESFNQVEGVLGMQVDLSIQQADKAMVGELARIRREQIARSKPGASGRAYFIALRDDLRTAMLGSTASIMKLSQPKKPVAVQIPGPAGEPMPVVFVLRTVPAK